MVTLNSLRRRTGELSRAGHVSTFWSRWSGGAILGSTNLTPNSTMCAHLLVIAVGSLFINFQREMKDTRGKKEKKKKKGEENKRKERREKVKKTNIESKKTERKEKKKEK